MTLKTLAWSKSAPNTNRVRSSISSTRTALRVIHVIINVHATLPVVTTITMSAARPKCIIASFHRPNAPSVLNSAKWPIPTRCCLGPVPPHSTSALVKPLVILQPCSHRPMMPSLASLIFSVPTTGTREHYYVLLCNFVINPVPSSRTSQV